MRLYKFLNENIKWFELGRKLSIIYQNMDRRGVTNPMKPNKTIMGMISKEYNITVSDISRALNFFHWGDEEIIKNKKPPKLQEEITTNTVGNLDVDSVTSNKLINESFLATKKDVIKIKSLSWVITYIEKNSSENLDLQKIRDRLQKSSKFYGLKEVNPNLLTIENQSEININYDVNLELPIVIDKNGDIIDGRHRALLVKSKNKTLWAWVPMEM